MKVRFDLERLLVFLVRGFKKPIGVRALFWSLPELKAHYPNY